MPTNADTGNSATLTLSEDTNSYNVVSISPGGESVEMLEVSTLATTGFKEYISGDLKETPEGSAEVRFNVGTGLPTVGSTHTITVTFPVGPDQTTTTAATYAGTGFITSVEYGELANDTVIGGTISWKMDGATDPAFTKGN